MLLNQYIILLNTLAVHSIKMNVNVCVFDIFAKLRLNHSLGIHKIVIAVNNSILTSSNT